MVFTPEARAKAAATKATKKHESATTSAASTGQAEQQTTPAASAADTSVLDLLRQMQDEIRKERERNDRLEAKLAERAAAETEKRPTTPKEEQPTLDRAIETERPKMAEDDYLVTVLYGYGKVPANYRAFIDATEFVGGVARNVPWSIARHWVKGTRPDGGRAQGRVIVQVLPNDASPADFARLTGVSPLTSAQLAALLQSTNIDHLAESLGPERTRELAASLASRAR